jgi:hypothetical protein
MKAGSRRGGQPLVVQPVTGFVRQFCAAAQL